MDAESNGVVLCDVPPDLTRPDLERRTPCGPRFIDLTGQQVGEYTVVGFAGFIRGYSAWIIQCKCGKSYLKRANDFLHRHRTRTLLGSSCACIDGRSSHPLFSTWTGMRNRCYCETTESYESYGGRGIVVCDRWNRDFWAFAHDMGERPSEKHSIDRIDNDGPYSPENCRWATSEEQARNKRDNRFVTYRGETKTHSEWAATLGITRERFRQRVNALEAIGADPSEAITTPPGETMPSMVGSHQRYKDRKTAERRERFKMKDKWFDGTVVVLTAGRDFSGSIEAMASALRVESEVRGGKGKTRRLGERMLFQYSGATISPKSSGQTK